MNSRSVIVTGAGNGLGAEIARFASEAGWIVGVLDRDLDAASRVAASLGEHAIALEADITNEVDIEAAFDEFAARSGRPAPDGIVCNAGIVRFGPLLDLEASDWRAVVDVNLTGSFLTARTFARRVIAAGQSGAIVTVTSMNGVAAGPNAGAYGATKAGVALFTKQMALEWGPFGIRANALAPGLIDAGMSEPIYADAEIRRLRSERVPLGRLGTGADVASVALFLLSEDAAYVNGTELLVDGGVSGSVISTLPRPQSVDSVGSGERPPRTGGGR